MTKYEDIKNGVIFPLGEPNEAYQEYFSGQSYLANLVAEEDLPITVGNVSFEPGCRNHWHIHRRGYQILLVTGGEGWYQEAGQPAQRLEAGDVVVIKEGIKHWHGATQDAWFSHLAITAGESEWLEAVDDEEYSQLD